MLDMQYLPNCISTHQHYTTTYLELILIHIMEFMLWIPSSSIYSYSLFPPQRMGQGEHPNLKMDMDN